MMVDSLEMTDRDRDIIVEKSRATPEMRVLITHGGAHKNRQTGFFEDQTGAG